MSAAEIQYKRMPGDILSVDLMGKWQLGQKVPSVDKLADEFKRQPPVKQIDGFVGEKSDIRRRLGRSMDEIADAARSLKSLTDYLERHPESLLKGKGSRGG